MLLTYDHMSTVPSCFVVSRDACLILLQLVSCSIRVAGPEQRDRWYITHIRARDVIGLHTQNTAVTFEFHIAAHLVKGEETIQLLQTIWEKICRKHVTMFEEVGGENSFEYIESSKKEKKEEAVASIISINSHKKILKNILHLRCYKINKYMK